MERAFVDTSAWAALANRADPDHGAVRSALTQWKGRLVTSNLIFAETVTLCRVRFGHSVAVVAGDRLLDGSMADLLRADAEDEREAWDLMKAREDKQYSFVDCTSFVLMRRLGLRKAITLDEDFSREGFEAEPGTSR